MEIKIEEAKFADIAKIKALGDNCPDFYLNEDNDLFWPDDILKTIVDNDDAIMLVAKDKSKVVGFVIGGIVKSMKKLVIENIFVKPDYRRQGIGTNLCKNLVIRAQKQNCVYICTLANRATKFCEKIGFVRGDKFTWYSYPLGDKND